MPLNHRRPNLRLRPTAPSNCVDEPYFDLTPSRVHVVEPGRPTSDPPGEVLKRLSPESRESFLQMWKQLPPHLRDINFDLHGSSWEPAVIKELSDVLLEFQDRISRSKTDLGHCKTLPFETHFNLVFHESLLALIGRTPSILKRLTPS